MLIGIQGCTDIQAPGSRAWEGTLAPVDKEARLSGRVAAVSEPERTRASIAVEEAQPYVIYSWRLRTGTCDSPGEPVGGLASYPELSVSAGGTASEEAVLSEALRETGDYHAVVLAGADPGTVVACGTLEQVTFGVTQ